MSFMEQIKANQEMADARLKTKNDGSGLNAQRVQGSKSRIHRDQHPQGPESIGFKEPWGRV